MHGLKGGRLETEAPWSRSPRVGRPGGNPRECSPWDLPPTGATAPASYPPRPLTAGVTSTHATRQHLPDAMGAQEIPEAALLQTVPGVVDRGPRSRTRPVQTLDLGARVRVDSIRRASDGRL